MTDKELVEGCIREDKIVQRELWNRFSGKLLSLCMRYCKNTEEAEDALMEAFVKIYNNMDRFRYQSSLETWMRRICVNVSINKIRARKNIWQDLSESEYELGYDDYSFENLQLQDLLDLINTLPDGYRAVFNMFAIEGFSHKEIANELGIDEGTSRSQLAKARKSLQNHLNKMKGGES